MNNSLNFFGMSHIFSSSVGKKIVMSLSGLFLITFLLLHLSVNLSALAGAETYNAACHFMDTNPLIKVMVPVLAIGFLVHILYAFWLTICNRQARGTQGYAVGSKSKTTFASRNMFVLGLIVLGILCLHMTHFWAKMQLLHFTGGEPSTNPYELLKFEFSQLWVVLLYLVWFVALWFHLTHGFWSAFQTLGANNNKWFPRLQALGYILATVIIIGFIIIPIFFYFS